ncbi:MAG: chlorite dismutase family protein [Lentisphaeria bacterium]|nr:chlorite dismutase family protein [Lentisphaeria bacterium]NQZ70235.1 chlorite dismutase family protein [Lentisphaeria bacterium]
MSDEITDIREKGMGPDHKPQYSERRVYFQLLVWTECADTEDVVNCFKEHDLRGCVIEDVNDPYGIAIITFSEDPAYFVETVRPVLNKDPFADLVLKDEYTMLGRTYAIGYEQDLDETLLKRPVRNLLRMSCPWIVFYPLKRKGEFNTMEIGEQRKILGEHGVIGRAFGEAGLAQDIRLASFGLDKNDNDFTIGLVSKELIGASAIVQAMRKTEQTSNYMEHMGPFFVGHKVFASTNPYE